MVGGWGLGGGGGGGGHNLHEMSNSVFSEKSTITKVHNPPLVNINVYTKFYQNIPYGSIVTDFR